MMPRRVGLIILFVALVGCLPGLEACCPAGRSGQPVVNADQTVILIWDAAKKTQHFIRKASFKAGGDDFGFLIPSPSQPELEESGNDAFPLLAKLTAPEVIKRPRPASGAGCGCNKDAAPPKAETNASPRVTVLAEKTVAGFDAVVLEAKDAGSLTKWLKDHGYAFSPEVEVWAKPYIEQNWKITALKVAKSKDGNSDPTVSASALRLTFQTDRPLFPYREPDTKQAAKELGAARRLLRIYFLSDAKYDGELTQTQRWTGKVAWAGKVPAEKRAETLKLLKLPESTGPAEMYLTEFEDPWPYQLAPADVYFVKAKDQDDVRRQPIIEYTSNPLPTDGAVVLLACGLLAPKLLRRSERT